MTRLEQIRARVDAATEGPWEVVPAEDAYVSASVRAAGGTLMSFGGGSAYEESAGLEPSGEDLSFIAHARADVPWLLDRVAELEAALKHVEWEADPVYDHVLCRGCAGDFLGAGHDSECLVYVALAGVTE